MHPKLGAKCFGRNAEASSDIYCRDCDSRKLCEQTAIEEVRAIMREYRERKVAG